MDTLGALLIPLVIAYAVAPIAAFFMAINNKKRIVELFQRLESLDRRVAGGIAPAPARPVALETPPAQEDISEPVREPPPSAAPAPQAEAAAPPPSPPPASPPQAPPPPRESLEQVVGTRWVVWVGGLALALGGIFLVSYAVEQGFFGPGLRVAMAGIFAALLIAAGEWARRNDKIAGFTGLPSAYVPGILTAAGTAVAFATVYASFALYHFIGPAPAFLLLGLVAIATLVASLLHGPALAAFGLIGAEVTPLLVPTAEPNYWALYIYLAVVTAAAFALARIRLWRWLAITAVVFSVLWALPEIDGARALEPPIAFSIAAGFVLAAIFIVCGLLAGPPATPGKIDAISSIALSAYLVVAMVFTVTHHHDTLTLTLFSVLAVATVGIAWQSEAAAAAVPVSAIVVALVMFAFAARPELAHLVAPGNVAPDPATEPAVIADAPLHLMLGAAYALVFGAAGFLAQGRSIRAVAPMLFAAAGVFAPVAILAALYHQIAGFERSIPFALLALGLAALFAWATELLTRREPRPGSGAAQAIYATGAIAALALAFTFALEKGWLTVALALMVPGIAWVERQRPLPALRRLASIMVALVIARIAWEPRIVGSDVGTTPIFNWILYGYGLPALAFWTGGYLLRQRADDAPARSVDSAAILFTVLTVTLEIRHYINNGDIYAASSGLTEVALQACAGLAMAIGLEHLRARTHSIVHNAGAIVIAALTFCVIAIGLLIAVNPMWTPRPVGPPFINLVLLGYGIPAILAVILALRARTTRPIAYRAVAAITAVVLSLAYLTMEVARLYQGPLLTQDLVSNAQQYTYSAVWLVYGVLLLIVGLLLPSKPARLASGAVMLLTVVKVFLIDMSDLAGIWRALSFIGLGLVLVGIGYLYQRLLFPPPRPPAAQPT